MSRFAARSTFRSRQRSAEVRRKSTAVAESCSFDRRLWDDLPTLKGQTVSDCSVQQSLIGGDPADRVLIQYSSISWHLSSWIGSSSTLWMHFCQAA